MNSRSRAANTAVKSKKNGSPKPDRTASGASKTLACKAITARHFRVLEDLQSGMAVSAVAKKNHLTRQSVWNVRQAFKRGGRDALVCTVTGGRRPSIGDADALRLRAEFCKPVEGGAPFVWTVPEATRLAHRLLASKPNRITVRKTMHRNDVGMLGDLAAPWLDGRGWSPAMRQWVRSGLPEIRRRSRREGSVVLAVAAEPLVMRAADDRSPDEAFVRLSAIGGREPVRSALLRGAGTPRALERFLQAVAAAAGHPPCFVLEEGALVVRKRIEDFSRRTGIRVLVLPEARPARG